MGETILCRHGSVAIRLMRDAEDEYARMVKWRNQPHVREWWDPDDPPLTIEDARNTYGPRTTADSDTTACIITLDDRPIGYLQFYPWEEYPEQSDMGVSSENWWGIDILIGDPDQISVGRGTEAVRAICDYLFVCREAAAVALTVDKTNARAFRAYNKAGFVSTISVLDTDTRDGERVECWLMVNQHS